MNIVSVVCVGIPIFVYPFLFFIYADLASLRIIGPKTKNQTHLLESYLFMNN